MLSDAGRKYRPPTTDRRPQTATRKAKIPHLRFAVRLAAQVFVFSTTSSPDPPSSVIVFLFLLVFSVICRFL